MSFINMIDKFSRDSAQKVKDVAETAKLTSAISDEEKRMNNLFVQIGRLYVEKHDFDCEPEFTDLVSAVKESENKITAYRLQIKRLKSVVRCQICGAELAPDSAFCNVCGNSVAKPTQTQNHSDMIQCGKCGAWEDKNMRFCTSCGNDMTTPITNPNLGVDASADFKKNPDLVKDNTVTTDVPNIDNDSPSFLACPVCGAALEEEDDLFCAECGAKLR